MWVLEPMEIPDIGDMVLSNIDLDSLLNLRQTSKGAKLIADARLRRLYNLIYKSDPGDMEMKLVISKLKKAIYKKEQWVFEEGIDKEFPDYYIFYGTKYDALKQWAMITVSNTQLEDLQPYNGHPYEIKTIRDLILALYKSDGFELKLNELPMTDEITEVIYHHFEGEGKYEENPEIPYIFDTVDTEIPIKDSVIERFMRESPTIMTMSDFLIKKLWPPSRRWGNVYKIEKPIPFGYDLEVKNIDDLLDDSDDYIVDANRSDYKQLNDTDDEDLSDYE